MRRELRDFEVNIELCRTERHAARYQYAMRCATRRELSVERYTSCASSLWNEPCVRGGVPRVLRLAAPRAALWASLVAAADVRPVRRGVNTRESRAVPSAMPPRYQVRGFP